MSLSLVLKDSESNVATGLGTFSYTALVAGLYNVASQSSVVPPSGLSVVINKNGSPVATSIAPSAAAQVVDIQAQLSCAINDVITVVLSSSTASDLVLNNVKSIITINLTLANL